MAGEERRSEKWKKLKLARFGFSSLRQVPTGCWSEIAADTPRVACRSSWSSTLLLAEIKRLQTSSYGHRRHRHCRTRHPTISRQALSLAPNDKRHKNATDDFNEKFRERWVACEVRTSFFLSVAIISCWRIDFYSTTAPQKKKSKKKYLCDFVTADSVCAVTTSCWHSLISP